MNRLVWISGLAGVMLAGAASVSAAHDAPQAASLAKAPRAVLECRTDAMTRTAFRREHGSAPVFITAREAVRAARADAVWSAPRCMTPREYARLTQAMADNARVR